METNFAIQITFNDEYLDENSSIRTKERVILLDAVTEPSSSASNTLPNHPIVSGDMISDHSYKNPLTLSFNASIALKGHNGAALDDVSLGPQDAIEIFDKIRTRAYLCTIVKINTNNDKDIRFARYPNMVITSTVSTERLNTVTIQFQWQQVMLAEVQDYAVDISDEFLPNVTEPTTLSFTNSIIDYSAIDKAVIDYMLSADLIDTKFLDFVKSAGATYLVGIGAGAATAGILISVFGASGPVGWIAGGVVASVILTACAVKALIKVGKRAKYKVKAFKYKKNTQKQKQEVKRFTDFIEGLHEHFEQLNNFIAVYQVASDEEQECMVNIDNQYYVFTFTRNTTSGGYSLKITDPINNDGYVGGTTNVFAGISDFSSCTKDNAILTTSGSYVYLICPSIKNVKLNDCFIVVSKINPEDFNKLLDEIIEKALVK